MPTIASRCFRRAGALPLVRLNHLRSRQLAGPARCTIRPRAAAADAAPAAATPAAPKYATLPADQQRQVDVFLDILLDWNQRMNLTAIKDRGEAYERHINDSLALLPALDRCLAAQQHARQAAAEGRRQQQQQDQRQQQQQRPADVADSWERGGGAPAARTRSSGGGGLDRSSAGADEAAAPAPRPPRLIDVGSGAGLPGIVLAIARPEWEVTLLDSLQKRCKFSEAAVEAAGLRNVRVHWARAEEAGQDASLRQRHDAAIARAVAELRVLAELCLPLVRPGGHWVAAKGAAPGSEVEGAQAALSKLGGRLVGVEEVDSESPEGRRTAVIVLKASSTPARYPRLPGVPGKKPL